MQQIEEDNFYYLGQPFVVQIAELLQESLPQSKQMKNYCRLEFEGLAHAQDHVPKIKDKASLIIYWTPGLGKLHASVLRNLLEQWFRQQAKRVILDRVRKWSQVMNLAYNRVTLKDQKTRWGSCSSLRNLNFNWRLIMAPLDVLDYVVIHELAHLKEMNHSKLFWKIIEQYSPNYSLHKDWLKKHGASLFAVLAAGDSGQRGIRK